MDMIGEVRETIPEMIGTEEGDMVMEEGMIGTEGGDIMIIVGDILMITGEEDMTIINEMTVMIQDINVVNVVGAVIEVTISMMLVVRKKS